MRLFCISGLCVTFHPPWPLCVSHVCISCITQVSCYTLPYLLCVLTQRLVGTYEESYPPGRSIQLEYRMESPPVIWGCGDCAVEVGNGERGGLERPTWSFLLLSCNTMEMNSYEGSRHVTHVKLTGSDIISVSQASGRKWPA